MEKKYLDKYYPAGCTMEDRLFELGSRCTSTSMMTWVKTMAIGLAIALFGLLIVFTSDNSVVFGYVLFSLGDLLILIGIFGISIYQHGLKCLEKAELLYNTRCAAGQKPITGSSKKEKVTVKVNEEIEEPKVTYPEREEDFVGSILQTPTEDLKLILDDQRELYSEAEIKIIEEVLEKRMNK